MSRARTAIEELAPSGVAREAGPPWWKDAAVALSLANLCYLRIWSELLTYSPKDTYYMKHPPLRAEYAAAVLNTLVLGGILLLALRFYRRIESKTLRTVWRSALLMFLLLPLNAVRSVLANQFPYLKSPLFELLGTAGVLALSAGCTAVVFIALIFWSRRLTHVVLNGLLLLSPFVALTFAQAAWKAAAWDPGSFADKPTAPVLPARDGSPRVLWLILDEWDQRLTFIDRPAGLDLPEIDSFRAHSLYASNAYSPAGETIYSLPALVTGELVERAREDGPNELLLGLPGSDSPVKWSQQRNVFENARASGFNTAIVGWYHPYCRLFGDDLSSCTWEDMGRQANSMGDNLSEIAINQDRSLFETTLLSAFGQSLSAKKEIRAYHTILAQTEALAAKRDYGLALAHMPVPHSPHSYNRKTGQWTLANSPVRGYVDSLKLADITIGNIRAAMQRAGTWDTTTIVLTTDHSFRSARALDGKADHRIPFMLKMAGHEEGVQIDHPFNTIVTGDLILAILRREVSSPEQAAAWIKAHSKLADSPYNYNDKT